MKASFAQVRRGSSLLEVLVSGTCLLVGMVGVMILVQHTARTTGQADFNVHAAKRAQELLTGVTSAGFTALQAKLGTTDTCNGVFTNGQAYVCTVDYVETSGVGALPNLGQPSMLVRVIIQRANAVALLGGRRFIVETYVLPNA